MIKPGMTITEKVRIKASPEWKEYMNSPEVVEQHRAIPGKIRKYHERRQVLRDKLKNL